ncbi:hypothetical protein [Tunturiibacter gelidiferens]|uniref:hypothetical protein n=1 Tax=Tunturiibacter gelidiferens TaxID=3069689 RepID=UPI003D9B006B
MMSVEQVQLEMKDQFARAGLLPFLIEESSQVLDLGDEFFAEVVLSDRAKLGEANDLMREILSSSALGGKSYTLVVRSKWLVESVGDPAPAYGQDGGLRAAVLIPIILQSGSERTPVTVAVTKLAEMEFDRILGRKTDLKQVAKLVIDSALRRGGRSFWDPTTENYLEVASGAVANISRLLKQTA